MSAARKVILAMLGSAGDVHPFIGLGVELSRRGHEVVVVTSALFASTVQAAGLQCHALGTVEEALRLLGQVDPRDNRSHLEASRAVLNYGLGPVHQAVTSLIEPNRTIVIHNQMCFGARIAQETHGVPLVTMVMQPFSLRSAIERRRYHPRAEWFTRLGIPARRLFNALVHRFFFDQHVAPVINRFRSQLKLPPISWRRNPHWLFSPQRILGAWPDWFGPAQPDWPSQVSLTGFVMHDRFEPNPDLVGRATPCAPFEPPRPGRGAHGVAHFTDAVGNLSGSVRPADNLGQTKTAAPIVFTPGSWVARGEHLFAPVIEACRRLGRPGVLVTRYGAQIPKPLPPDVRHVEYAPFSELFPQAAVVIHHGGVGTAAQGLRAGRPQICVPLSGDQYDNSARLARLGVGTSLPQSRFTGEHLARTISHLLENPAVEERCRQWQRQVDAAAAVRLACDCIEQTQKF